MNLRTYQAHSLTEALTRIKSDLGEDAVVLHSRTFRRGGVLGIGGRVIYEVTASPPAPRPKNAKQPAPRPANSPRRSGPPDTTADANRAAAVALALAEQERRRRLASTKVPPSAPAAEQSVALAPPSPPTAREVKPLRRAPASAPQPRVIEPTVSPGPRPNSPPPLSVAQRYVLTAPAGDDSPTTDSPTTDSRTPDAGAGAARSRSARRAPRSTTINATTSAAAAPTAPPTTKSASDTLPPAERAPEPALQHEIAALKQMVSQVLQRQAGTLQSSMPEALYNQYVHLIENEVAQEIADELCDVVRRELSEAELTDPDAVRAAFRRHLARYVPTAPDTMLVKPDDGRPFTLALVGPTGVGKTTTVAKLAAAFKLRHGRRVGLITTDTYRIAAVDQLRTYANIIGLPLKVALTPEEMHEACESLSNCDVVLIDTAGRSPNDGARLEEIREFAKAANPHEVHLVLSSTCSEQALMRTIDRFSTVKTDRVIFTKTDEAVSLGVLVNVMHKAGKELSFITTGQEVPDHIEAGSPDRLAALVLGEKG